MVSRTLTTKPTTIAAGQTTSGTNSNLPQIIAAERTSSGSRHTSEELNITNRGHYQQQRSATVALPQQQERNNSLTLSSSSSNSITNTTSSRNNFYYRVEINETKLPLPLNGNVNHNNVCEYDHINIGHSNNNNNNNNTTCNTQYRYCNGGVEDNIETNNKGSSSSSINNNNNKHEPTSVNLTQALYSTSSLPPPINDQISHLFPKCKPKYNNNYNNNSNNNNNNSTSTICEPGKLINSSTATCESFKDVDNKEIPNNYKILNGSEKEFRKLDFDKPPHQHYYKSVNIITQSPPPHSTPSISSESLSSVTARISTNPFLSNINTNQEKEETLNEYKQLMEDTDIGHNAISSSSSFYLQRNNTQYINKSTLYTKRDDKQQINGDEMPRKRSLYERYHHAAVASGNNPNNSLDKSEEKAYYQQQQQQKQTQQKQITDNQSNQNPFVKDNYWETMRKQQKHNTTAATVLNSPNHSGNRGSEVEARNETHRRPILHQTHQNQTQQQHQQHQQQRHIRLGNSPLRRNDHNSYDVIQKRNNYNTQQSKNQQKQNSAATSEGTTQTVRPPPARPQSSSILATSISTDNRSEKRNHHDDNDYKREREHQRSKTLLSSEHDEYTTAAYIRESMTEQTSNTTDTQRERCEHHYAPKQTRHQTHHCQLIEEPQPTTSSNTEVIYEDITKNWQTLRVSTESFPVSSHRTISHTTEDINNTTTAAAISSNIVEVTPSYVYNKQTKSLTSINQKKDFKQDDIIYSANNGDFELSCRERKKYSNRDFTINMEPRQGIMEYEGSPRRIGQMMTNFSDEGYGRVENNNFLSNNKSNATSKVTSPKEYTIRPGFPQRIISPPRETTPPIMLQNSHMNTTTSNNKYQLQQQQQYQHQQQTITSQQTVLDNNTEDTSNDVSEIGTISDLTTSDVISATNTVAVSTYRGNVGQTDEKDKMLKTLKSTDDTVASVPTKTLATTVTVACTNNICTPLSMLTAAPLTISTAATTLTTMSTSNLLSIPTKSSTFDYLYEFSETRKVLEEFFKCPSIEDKPIIENISDVDSVDIQYEFHTNLERDIDDNEADINNQIEREGRALSMGDGDSDGVGVGAVNDIEVVQDQEDEDVVDNEEDDDDVDNGDDGGGVENEVPIDVNNTDTELTVEADDDDDNDDELQIPLQPTQHQPNQQSNIVTQSIQYPNQNQNHQHNRVQSAADYSFQYQNDINGKVEMLDDDADDDVSHVERVQHHHFQQPQQQQQQQQQQQRYQPGNQNQYKYQSSQQQQQPPLLNSNHTPEYVANNRYARHSTRRHYTGSPLMRDFDFFLDSASRSSGEQCDQQQDSINHNQQYNSHSRHNYHYTPETTDYDSNCGDLDSLSGELNGVWTSCTNYSKYYASSMPVLEDGLSSGHTSDTENNNQQNFLSQQNSSIQQTPATGGISMLMDLKHNPTNNTNNSMNGVSISTTDATNTDKRNLTSPNMGQESSFVHKNESTANNIFVDCSVDAIRPKNDNRDIREMTIQPSSPGRIPTNKVFKNIDPDLDSLYSINVFNRNDMVQMTPPPPAPAPHRKPNISNNETETVLSTTSYRDLCSSTNNSSNSPNKNCSIMLPLNTSPSHDHIATIVANTQPPSIPERIIQRSPSPVMNSPVWVTRHLDISGNKPLLESPSENYSKNLSGDEEDVDTDLETDRLLGHQRLDDQGYYEENKSWERKPSRSLLSKISPKQVPSTKTRNGYNALLSSTPEIPPPVPPKTTGNKLHNRTGSTSSPEHSDKSPLKSIEVIVDCVGAIDSPGDSEDSAGCPKKDCDNSLPSHNNSNSSEVTSIRASNANNVDGIGTVTNNNCTTVASNSSGSIEGSASNTTGEKKVKKSKNKEGGAVLIEGVLFRAKYLGSTQLVCEGQPTKSTRMMQAEEAVSRIKAPDGDVQPSTEVDLFISTEKIMVLNTDLKEIMMDHALRTISYIADIGDLVVLMARRRFVPQDLDDGPKPNRTPKMICHVFESDEAQFIAQSIGQAFQVAYMEFLKANGIEDHRFVKEMDYQEVLNSQEIFGDELEIFAKKELQKEVVVPKAKGEILGVVIVESGWGSMLPTVVIANLMSAGAAARCGQLNIGDQLIAINGLSLVGLPLSTCQNYIKNTKNQTVVKFTVVPCPPVVEVKIKRPETKYQLGFSVQNGVICSLLRGGIAERGGVRVGHRIIEINNQSVVAVPHEKIVNLLATSVGEILMKTMPTSMFRLLTGQENPIYI